MGCPSGVTVGIYSPYLSHKSVIRELLSHHSLVYGIATAPADMRITSKIWRDPKSWESPANPAAKLTFKMSGRWSVMIVLSNSRVSLHWSVVASEKEISEHIAFSRSDRHTSEVVRLKRTIQLNEPHYTRYQPGSLKEKSPCSDFVRGICRTLRHHSIALISAEANTYHRSHCCEYLQNRDSLDLSAYA
jgi:hypothetical protein